MSSTDSDSEGAHQATASGLSAYYRTIATIPLEYWGTLDRGWKALAAAFVVLTVTLADIPIGW